MDHELAISLQAVEKAWGNKKVLKGVDLSVPKGSIYALLGSNGAGKTTTIKILSTLIHLDSGVAKICGYDVTRQPDQVREQISLTGQFAAVDDVLTGRANLRLIGALRHLPDATTQADELLKRFGLENAAEQPVSTYSGGMRRRLDIAMSMMGDPAIIFLDEPTTGLDPQSRAAMWRIIKELAGSGATILLSTQYLEEAEHLADRIAILDDGVIVAEGTPGELKQKLPQGVIEFAFQNREDIFTVSELLSDFKTTSNEDMLSLTVVTDGSMEQLTEIFTRIKECGVETSSFTQKLPTLEDVFYILIGDKKEAVKQ